MKSPLFPVLAAAVFLACFALPARAAIVTKDISYVEGGAQLKGTFVYDDAVKSPVPGVIVVPEWWGLNDYARHRAAQLAGLGYAALAVDMYGANVLAQTPQEATALTKPFYDNRDMMRRRAEAAITALKSQPQVDASRLAAIGYCFGGTVVLELARGSEPLKGVVSFHGGLSTPTPAKPGAMYNAPRVLALNGGADPTVPQKDKDAFVAEMKAAGANFRSIDYPGAMHAFTNPDATAIGQKFNMPVAYDADADKASFEEMRKFLGEVLK